jgi:hypothetical protein
MKWLVYSISGYEAGHFFCDDKDRGFRNWCWVRKANPTNYMVVPAPSE